MTLNEHFMSIVMLIHVVLMECCLALWVLAQSVRAQSNMLVVGICAMVMHLPGASAHIPLLILFV
jgi:hypothetical protein